MTIEELDIVKVIAKGDENSPPWDREYRFNIIKKDTGEIIDDAQGYGYKSYINAKKAMWYKFGGDKKINVAKNFWKKQPELKSFVQDLYENNVKEIALGEYTEDDIVKTVKEKLKIDLDKKFLKHLEF